MTTAHFMRLASCLASLLLVVGCQTAGSDTSWQERNQRQIAAELLRMEVRIGEEARSFSNFTVNGFRAINEHSLVVTAGVHDHYLVTLASPCLGLPYAFAVGLQSQTSNVTSFDSIIVRSLHDRPERCRIEHIYHLEDVAAATPE